MARSFDYVICTPESYASMHSFIEEECMESSNAWIYNIIEDKWPDTLDEEICLRTSLWSLVKNKHHGNDLRFLVIFHDKSLKTIRNLTQSHVELLQQVQRRVTEYLKSCRLENYVFYFHYLPSVFQLHLHVNSRLSPAFTAKPNDRIQPLSCVLSNLKKNSLYYANALILTKHCKTRHRAEIHTKKTTK